MAEQPRIDAAIAATEHWLDYLEDLHARIARRFRRPEVRKRIRHYLAGLLAEIDARMVGRWRRPSERPSREAHSAS